MRVAKRFGGCFGLKSVLRSDIVYIKNIFLLKNVNYDL